MKVVAIILAARIYLLMIAPTLYVTGAAMNQAVIVANHGKFPVMMSEKKAGEYEDGYIDEMRVLMTKDTKLNWLGDLFNFHELGIYSPGDMLIILSSDIWVFLAGCWFSLIVHDLRRSAAASSHGRA